MAVESARELVLVDVEARRVVRRQQVPGRPHNLTVAPNGTVVATLQRAGTVAIVRGGSVSSLRLGGSPHDVKATDDLIVVANEGAARLDLVSPDGRPVGRIALKANPHDLAIAPGDDVAWVSLDGTDEIAVVDLRRRGVRRYLPTGERPHDLLFGPDGRVWVTDWSGALHVFTAAGERSTTVDVGDESHHLAFTHDGREGWITDHGARRVFVTSVETLRIVETIPIEGAPHHIAMTGNWAAVADHDRGTLVVYDVATRREIGEVEVGAGPHGVWAAASG